MNSFEWEKRLREQAQSCRDAAGELDKKAEWVRKGEFRFEVELLSLWGNEGEVDVRVSGHPGENLKKVLDRADAEFKHLNDRSDVQAKRKVCLLFPDNTTWLVTQVVPKH